MNRLGAQGAALRQSAPQVVWLIVVWMLLWGTFSIANLLSGLLLALVLLRVLPMPAIHLDGRLKVVPLLRFTLRFARDLCIASFQVAWRAVRPGPEPMNAVVAVRLRGDSDLALTMTAQALSLTPGSLIIEIVRTTSTLYVHVLDVDSVAELEEFRARVLEMEARLIRAFGSLAANEALDAEATTPGAAP